MKAVGYIRVSTEEQAREGVSLDNQRKRIEAFCVAKDWTLGRIYADEGISGSSLRRDGVQELISDCKRGIFDVVVIYKLDRLTRSVKDLGNLIEMFDKSNVAFSSVSDNFDTTTANGKLVLNILGSVAQWERDIVSERTRDALAHKRSEGKVYTRILPLGFDKAEDGSLVENPAEMKTVKLIKRMRKTGKSLQGIADRLNSRSVKTKTGGKWYKSTVSNVLSGSVYA
ncbi:hypothetical protein LCGC14_0876860 [marine sediment metagenome]|uniref:Resolvase/invertase-type recombinase catalytic domain-containing protein n=1 Tax=marine sediment metagenome TaxID=412755 RepID=A0A0F9SA17_9ZZZZ